MTQRMYRLGAAVATVALIGSVAWLGFDHGRTGHDERQARNADDSSRQTPQAVVPEISTAEPQQLRAFSVLRKPVAIPSPAMKAAIEKTLGTEVLRLGLNLNLAHRVVTAAGIVAWVVPGNHFICVFRDRTGTAVCDTALLAIAYGMRLVASNTTHSPAEYYVLGIAPNGVSAVKVSTRGHTRTVAVTDNVYSYRAHSSITVESLG